MRNSLILIPFIALINSGFVHAFEGSFDVARHSTNLNLELGSQSTGLFVNGTWLRSNDNGSTTGIGLGYNFDFGQLRLSPAVKTMYAHPPDGKAGMVLAFGSTASYRLSSLSAIYGDYFYAPKSFTEHLDHYKSMGVGISFRPLSLLSLRLGYQYVTLKNNNDKDNILIDGPYLSASVKF